MNQAHRTRLDGWKCIAARLRVSLRQARRLASGRIPDDERLPVFRMRRGPATRVCAYVDDLDAWEQRVAALIAVITTD